VGPDQWVLAEVMQGTGVTREEDRCTVGRDKKKVFDATENDRTIFTLAK